MHCEMNNLFFSKLDEDLCPLFDSQEFFSRFWFTIIIMEKRKLRGEGEKNLS